MIKWANVPDEMGQRTMPNLRDDENIRKRKSK